LNCFGYGNSSLICESLELQGVWNNYSNKEMLERVTIDKDLCYLWDLPVDVLELLWSDVLSLRKFKDIFCAINYF
jgi:hypothetical protein